MIDIIRKDKLSINTVNEKWGSLTWLANSNVLKSEGLTLGRVVIKKDMKNEKHCHPNSEEVLYLLSGRLEHYVGSEKIILENGDSIIIRAGIMHYAVNIGDVDAEMVVAYSKSEREIKYKD